MHVLFLSHYFPPEVNAPATRTFEHCKRWIAAGHQVTVITCAPNCPQGVVFEGYENSWRREELIEGINVIRVWTYLAANEGFFGRILNYMSYMLTATLCAVRLRGVDVIVATSPQFFCGWAGVFCHWFRRWPFVLEVRDIWPESIVTVGAMKQSPVIRMLEWLEKRMYRAADHIVTVGRGYRRQLLERRVAADKISIVTNGVDCTAISRSVDRIGFRRRFSAEDKFVCAYVGTIGIAHGLEVVLQAAEELKKQLRNDIVFWIVGDGASRRKLQQEAERLELDNVRFTGLVSKESVADIIANSDACLVHLRKTALFGTVIPSKIFEAMALNVPIVIGVQGDAERIVVEGRAGIVMTPEDPDSLLNCLATIQCDPHAFQHGRHYVALHFDRNKLADRMLQILMEVAAFEKPSSSDIGDELQPAVSIRRAA